MEKRVWGMRDSPQMRADSKRVATDCDRLRRSATSHASDSKPDALRARRVYVLVRSKRGLAFVSSRDRQSVPRELTTRLSGAGRPMAHETVDTARRNELSQSDAVARHPSTQSDVKVRMLRLKQVLDRTGLGKTTIYGLQKRGQFPQSVPLTSNSVRWIESEVEDWLARQAATRASRPRN
jgi:prophage regulatory protein